jgi:glycosyltransferase involved in cell wall biosynthesis
MSDDKRLLVVAPEAPWPTTHGGRVDIWNRYEGLVAEGWSLALLFWSRPGEEPDAAARAKLGTVFARLIERPLRRDIGARALRLLRTLRQPSLVALRHPDDAAFNDLLEQARAFAPAAVVSEFVYVSAVASRLAKALGVPLIVRSHNIEHRYMATQHRLATSLKQRLQIAAARLHLKGFETTSLRNAWAVLDISQSDAELWRQQGVSRVHWVPSFFPRLQSAVRHDIAWQDRRFDVGYLGNLWAPNNVAAVTWFIADILPLIRRSRPDVRVMIAGSNASAELIGILEATPNVTFIPHPADADMARADVRVLINPIREGSGINTKSVEMLYANSPVVVTPFAVNGMSAETADAFAVATSAEEFATKTIAAMDTPYTPNPARLLARERFGRGGARAMSEILLDEAAAYHQRVEA